MPHVPITRLRPGMMVKSTVHNRIGKVLVEAGTELDVKHIRVLKTWGISSVHVDASSSQNHTVRIEAPQDNAGEHWVRAALQMVLPRFQLNRQDDPFIRELRQFCVLRQAKVLMREQRREH